MAEAVNGYKILLMNTGQDGSKPSPAAKRQEAFKKIVDDLKPSIIFVQECTGPFAKKLDGDYLKLGTPEAGFIFDVNEFLHKDYTQDTDIATLINRLTKEQKISSEFQFLGRVRVVRFTSKGVPSLDMIALSWHGQYLRLTDQNKIKFLKELFVVVKEIRKMEKFSGKDGGMLPLIVGGDFNIEIPKWPSDPDLVYHRYTPSKRRKDRMIDAFVSTKNLTVKDCKVVDLSFKLDDGTAASDFLRHDPIQAILSCSNGSNDVLEGKKVESNGKTNSTKAKSPPGQIPPRRSSTPKVKETSLKPGERKKEEDVMLKS